MKKLDMQQRQEAANEASRKMQRKEDKVVFRVEDEDVLILSGQYAGHKVRDLFQKGPLERDYVVKKIWFTGDPQAVKVVNSLVCS